MMHSPSVDHYYWIRNRLLLILCILTSFQIGASENSTGSLDTSAGRVSDYLVGRVEPVDVESDKIGNAENSVLSFDTALNLSTTTESNVQVSTSSAVVGASMNAQEPIQRTADAWGDSTDRTHNESSSFDQRNQAGDAVREFEDRKWNEYEL